MVRKKLAMAVLALSALHADLASALGLGNLAVKSSLNQPLNAEIKLLDTGDLDPSQIKVQLATPEDFERAGVDRNFFLTNLKFAVDIDGRGTGTIRITTHDAVVEPYLNFVVEAKWPSGRLLREFAVLLDPPTFSGGAAAPAARPATSAPRAAATPAPTRQLEPPKISTVPAPSTADRLESNTMPETSSATEHRVQVGDTLSKIAAQHKPGDASVQQTMVAIQRANPDAFINSNINLIKSGSVLRLPSAEDTRAVSAGDAAQQIATQTHAWRSGGAGETASGPQLDASQPQAADAAGPQDKERLTIATPGSSDKGSVGEGSAKGNKSLDALRNQLSASQETLDGAKRDNKELQSRLDDMERQVATLQRLIALKDDQLAAVQAKTAEQAKTAAPTVPAPLSAPDKAAQEKAAQTSEPVVQAPSADQRAPIPEAAPAQATVPVPVAPPPTTAAKPVVKAPPAPEPSFIDKLTSEPLYWGGALAALALLLGGALVAKKRREQEEDEGAYQELDVGDYAHIAELEADNTDLDSAAISDDSIVPAAAFVAGAEEPEKKLVRSETGDAIAEADIYIAYGRYQQAVDLLSTAIDAEPNRSDLRVKLLEVFLEMRNREEFRQQFIALQSLGDGAAVSQVKEMLSSLDGVSDWLDDLPQPSSSHAGLAAAGFAAGAAAVVAADQFNGESDELSLDDDLDLDLDLNLDEETPLANVPEPTSVAALPAEPLEDLELDLDLDGDFGDDLGLPSTDNFAAPVTEPEPAFDPFSQQDAASALTTSFGADGAIDLDLDEDELDLDLNEEDLDFALRAMEGDKAEGLDPSATEPFAPTPTFDEPSFLSDSFAQEKTADTDFELPDFDEPLDNPSFESPSIDLSSGETPAFQSPSFESSAFEVPVADSANISEPTFDPAPSLEHPRDELETFSLDDDLDSFAAADSAIEIDPLQDFDLSLAATALADAKWSANEFEASEASKMEADLGDLSELEDLGDLNFDVSAASDFAASTSTPASIPELTNATGDDFDFLADTDEVATKLDLARAYIDMGDTDGAKDILDEVLSEGSDVQKQEASELLGRIA